MSSETIDSTFSAASEYLKSKYSCLFGNKNHLKWVVSTWCRKITASNIKKVGNESDVQLLGDARVSCHKKKRKRKANSSSAAEKKRNFFALLDNKGDDGSSSDAEICLRRKVFDVEINSDENDCSTTKLMQNAMGTFPSVKCSFCNVIPTTHRCRKMIRNGKYEFEGNRICGTSFCGPCMLQWGSEDRTLCQKHI